MRLPFVMIEYTLSSRQLQNSGKTDGPGKILIHDHVFCSIVIRNGFPMDKHAREFNIYFKYVKYCYESDPAMCNKNAASTKI